MGWEFAGVIAAAFIGVAGVVVVHLLGARDLRRQSEQAASERRSERKADRAEHLQARREEFLFRAVEHFGGGTQNRSVGIAVAEAYWKSVPEQHDVLVPLLLNQLVYLMAVVDGAKDAAHERQNVRRIVDLLEKIGDVGRFEDAYRSSLRAIDQRKPGRGLDLAPDEDNQQRVSTYLDDLRKRFPPDAE